MSSHHIIRDEQEPPVLIFELNQNWEELSELLGWSPIVLISPSLKEIFELRQTKIDGFLVNGSESVLKEKNNLTYTDANLAELLLNWIKVKNYTAINIFCNHELMIDLFNKFKNDDLTVPIIFFSQEGKHILKPNSKFKKWYPEKFMLDILNDDILTTENLSPNKIGYSVEKDGFVKIEVEGKLVLVKER